VDFHSGKLANGSRRDVSPEDMNDDQIVTSANNVQQIIGKGSGFVFFDKKLLFRWGSIRASSLVYQCFKNVLIFS
jgi:hypothetical protein